MKKVFLGICLSVLLVSASYSQAASVTPAQKNASAKQTAKVTPVYTTQPEAVATAEGGKDPVVITLDIPEPVVVEGDGITALRTAVSDLQAATREMVAFKQSMVEGNKPKSPTATAAEELVSLLIPKGETVTLRGVGDAVLFNLSDDAIIRVPSGSEKQILAAMSKIPKKQILQGKQYTFIVCNKRYFSVNTPSTK